MRVCEGKSYCHDGRLMICFLKFQFTSRTTRFVCVFFFLWIFRRKEGSKSTSRLIFMVVTTTYYEVLISDVDQYFIYPFNDKINGQLYCLILSVLPTYAYGIAISFNSALVSSINNLLLFYSTCVSPRSFYSCSMLIVGRCTIKTTLY